MSHGRGNTVRLYTPLVPSEGAYDSASSYFCFALLPLSAGFRTFSLITFKGIVELVERDRTLRDAALAYIIDNPRRFLELAGLKLIGMTRPYPPMANITPSQQYWSQFFVPVLILASMGLFLK
jgi:hypothetical protein